MRRPFFAACLLVIFCLAMVSKCGTRFPIFQAFSADSLPDSGTEITLTGTIALIDSNYIYLKKVQIPSTDSVSHTYKVSGLLLPWSGLDRSDLCVGQDLLCTGIFTTFSPATNPGQFDSLSYYAQKGYSGKLTDGKILGTVKEAPFIYRLLAALRNKWKSRLYDIFPSKEASILSDLLLGIRDELDTDTKRLYQQTGIAHILSISSLHISILGLALWKLLCHTPLPRFLSAPVTLSLLLLYWLLTGMSLSATRAIACFSLQLTASLLGRTYDSLTALGVPALFILFQTREAVFSASFLLSFGCALGIALLYPRLKDFFSAIPRKIRPYRPETPVEKVYKFLAILRRRLLDSLLLSLSITLFTMPITLYFFYELPTYGTFLNLLILPLLPLLMISGLFAMLLPGLGITGTAAYFILQFFDGLCKLFDSFPFASWNPGKPCPVQIVLYYLLLFLFMFCLWIFKQKFSEESVSSELFHGKFSEILSGFFSGKFSGKSFRVFHGKFSGILPAFLYIFPAVLPLIMLLCLGISTHPDNSATFLDMGQGDSILVTTDRGENYLFDGGSSSASRSGTYRIKPYLKSQGISHLEGIFISHFDKDHCNGILELLENMKEWHFTIDGLYLSSYSLEHPGELGQSILDAATEQGVPIHTIVQGDTWYSSAGSKTRFLCLHPDDNEASLDENNASACFLVTFFSSERESDSLISPGLLLTGDIGSEREDDLTRSLPATLPTPLVLKVSHHGSRYSTGTDFLKVALPSLAVISAGARNSYGHPHVETLERLQKNGSHILETSKCGAITIRFKAAKSGAEAFQVSTFLLQEHR